MFSNPRSLWTSGRLSTNLLHDVAWKLREASCPFIGESYILSSSAGDGSSNRSAPQPRILQEQVAYVLKQPEPFAQSQESLKVFPLQLADVMLGGANGGGLQIVADALQILLRAHHSGHDGQILQGSNAPPAYARSTDIFSSASICQPTISRPDWRFEVCSPFNWTISYPLPLEERG